MPLCHHCRKDVHVSGGNVDTRRRGIEQPCSRCGWNQKQMEKAVEDNTPGRDQ